MVGGTEPVYSASFDSISNQQDYDLQHIVSSSQAGSPWEGMDNKRIKIRQVYYILRDKCGDFMDTMVG
jgi:hypothetical protein